VNSTPISKLVPRQRATLGGRIEAVTSHQWPALSYKVEMSDGTGVVTLRFLGRRSLPGFEPGRRLSVEGTPADHYGHLVILNPLYSFLPDKYPEFARKVAVLLQALASNHPLPDGNKRTSLLWAILFAARNGYGWMEPVADDPDGTETAEVVEAASMRSIPLGTLSAWVADRLARPSRSPS
jgi:hypothetical protein